MYEDADLLRLLIHWIIFAVLEIKPRSSHMLSKCGGTDWRATPLIHSNEILNVAENWASEMALQAKVLEERTNSWRLASDLHTFFLVLQAHGGKKKNK